MSATNYLIFAILFYFYQAIVGEHEACKTVVWITHNVNDEAKSCWNWTDGNWYGGGSEVSPKWPLNKNHLGYGDIPAITGAEDGRTFSIDARFWLNSNGFSINVPMEIPLYIQIDPSNSKNRQICLVAKNPKSGGPYSWWFQRKMPHLSYTVCYANDVTNLTQFYMDIAPSLFSFPEKLPDLNYFINPVWSTWPALQNKMDHGTLVKFAEEIRRFTDVNDNDQKQLFLRIGRGWESCLGEFQFSSTSFADAQQTIDQLKVLRFNILLRAHPFIAIKCINIFQEAITKSYLVNTAPFTPAMSDLENEMVTSYDFTDTSANGPIPWWTNRLSQLATKYKFDGFYFEYGQSFYLENEARLSVNPNYYSNHFIQAAYQFGDNVVVNVGAGTQRYPMFVEIQKKSLPTWDSVGIKGVIPAVLQMGLSGYPFVLPDPIGGGDASTLTSDSKLYVRWLQLATFMPSMHFSWQFWKLDKKVIEIAQNMIKLRSGYNQTFIQLAQEAIKTGAPIIRPIWWIAPDDQNAHMIDDQFLVGNDILVAPIVTENDERQVYIPKGAWNDVIGRRPVYGPTTIKIKVALDQLFYFTRI